MEYKIITEERYDDVIKHLRLFFFADEPLNKAVGLSGDNKELEHHSLETLEDNISVMAVDENEEIAGVLLNGCTRPGDLERAQKSLEFLDDEEFKKIFQLLYSHNLKADVFEKFNVDKAFDLRMLSVDRRFRGKGIGNELLRYSEQVARDSNFKLMLGDATGIFSQKILKSNGFEVLSELYYNKYMDETGNPVFNVESPHIKLQLLYKVLN